MRPCRPGPMTKTAHLVVLRVGPRRVPDRHACSGVRCKGRRCGDCGASHQIVWYQAGFRRKAFSSATEKRNGRTCARRYCLRQCRRGRRPQTKKLSQGRETPFAGTHQPGWLRSVSCFIAAPTTARSRRIRCLWTRPASRRATFLIVRRQAVNSRPLKAGASSLTVKSSSRCGVGRPRTKLRRELAVMCDHSWRLTCSKLSNVPRR